MRPLGHHKASGQSDSRSGPGGADRLSVRFASVFSLLCFGLSGLPWSFVVLIFKASSSADPVVVKFAPFAPYHGQTRQHLQFGRGKHRRGGPEGGDSLDLIPRKTRTAHIADSQFIIYFQFCVWKMLLPWKKKCFNVFVPFEFGVSKEITDAAVFLLCRSNQILVSTSGVSPLCECLLYYPVVLSHFSPAPVKQIVRYESNKPIKSTWS